MGCGSSSQALSAHGERANGNAKVPNGNPKVINGKQSNGHHDNDDLPTVVLTDTPIKPKPPIAFEIPLEEFDSNPRSSTPPPHLQRLLQPPQPELSLPDIEEKLAEAELRRQAILQQRAASAQKRTQKMMKSFSEMEKVDSEHEAANVEFKESKVHHNNNVHIPPQLGVCEDKNIS